MWNYSLALHAEMEHYYGAWIIPWALRNSSRQRWTHRDGLRCVTDDKNGQFCFGILPFQLQREPSGRSTDRVRAS
jgi:hypothetical protein